MDDPVDATHFGRYAVAQMANPFAQPTKQVIEVARCAVGLDQGFISDGGSPMAMVYFPEIGKDSLYEALVYESELA